MSISWKKFIQCFCGVEFNSRVGLLSKNGGILLSGGKCRVWKGSGLLTQRWMCCQVDGRADVPGGSYGQDYFCCCSPWAPRWWIHPLRLCAHCCKKKRPGGRIVQPCISCWQLYVVVRGCRVLYVISTLFLSIKPQGLAGEREASEITNFCQVETLRCSASYKPNCWWEARALLMSVSCLGRSSYV